MYVVWFLCDLGYAYDLVKARNKEEAVERWNELYSSRYRNGVVQRVEKQDR